MTPRLALLMWWVGFALIVGACASLPPAPATADRTPRTHHYRPLTHHACWRGCEWSDLKGVCFCSGS